MKPEHSTIIFFVLLTSLFWLACVACMAHFAKSQITFLINVVRRLTCDNDDLRQCARNWERIYKQFKDRKREERRSDRDDPDWWKHE